MNQVLQAAVFLAAVIFVTVSATINALFLSSLGRTPLEAGLFASISLAGDLVKAVMPVLILRAILLRAWVQASVAALMLVIVVGVSLASGTGFAALTRGAATASRQAQSDQLAAARQDLQTVDGRLKDLASTRSASVIDAGVQATLIDRRWTQSKSCTELAAQSIRQYCAGLFTLKAELAMANDRFSLTAERQGLRTQIDALLAAGTSAETDPQAAAIADLLGIDRKLPRLVLTSALSIVLELGSVLLMLLAAGPTLRRWHEPGDQPVPNPQPAELPLQADRSLWRRQREAAKMAASERVERHAR